MIDGFEVFGHQGYDNMQSHSDYYDEEVDYEQQPQSPLPLHPFGTTASMGKMHEHHQGFSIREESWAQMPTTIKPSLLQHSHHRSYSADSLPENGIVDEDSDRNRHGKRVPVRACNNCKKAHLGCDSSRPCKRCVQLGKAHICVDVEQKRRGRPKALKEQTSAEERMLLTPTPTPIAHFKSSESTPIQTPTSPLLESRVAHYETVNSGNSRAFTIDVTLELNIIEADSNIYSVLGHLPHTLCGTSLLQLVYPDDHWTIELYLRDSQFVQSQLGLTSLISRLCHRNGQQIMMELTVQHTSRNTLHLTLVQKTPLEDTTLFRGVSNPSLQPHASFTKRRSSLPEIDQVGFHHRQFTPDVV